MESLKLEETHESVMSVLESRGGALETGFGNKRCRWPPFGDDLL